MIEVAGSRSVRQARSTRLKVDPAKLGGEVRKHLLKQLLVMYHANLRQGTSRTLARGEVAGSTRKMFRQKGTGNARTGAHSSTRSRRAAVTPSYSVRRISPGHAKEGSPPLATNAALLCQDCRPTWTFACSIAVKFDSIKTRPVVEMFKKLGLDRTVICSPSAGRDEK